MRIMRLNNRKAIRGNLTPGRAGFTVIELLVVISIIVVLLALILPSLRGAKLLANAIKCGALQRSLCAAIISYGVEQKEYPTNYCHDMAWSWNWGDECAGNMWGRPPYQTSYVYDTPPWYYPIQGASAMERLFASGQVSPVVNPDPNSNDPFYSENTPAVLCTGEMPPNYESGPDNGRHANFKYNGPSTNSYTLKNNGGLSGMFYLGRHGAGFGNGGEFYGLSYHYQPDQYTPADIAFLGCPTFYEDDPTTGHHDGWFIEPHGPAIRTPYWTVGYGNGQTDENAAFLPYNRNFTFGDGHGKYIVSASRANIP